MSQGELGTLIGHSGDYLAEPLKPATLAIEDKNFYKHAGFDVVVILRVFSRLITRGRAQ